MPSALNQQHIRIEKGNCITIFWLCVVAKINCFEDRRIPLNGHHPLCARSQWQYGLQIPPRCLGISGLEVFWQVFALYSIQCDCWIFHPLSLLTFDIHSLFDEFHVVFVAWPTVNHLEWCSSSPNLEGLLCFDASSAKHRLMLAIAHWMPAQSLADKLSDWGWTVEPNGISHVVFWGMCECWDGDWF